MKLIRNIVFWLHLVMGCVAGLVILALSITGVLLAFERQINAWADAPAALSDNSEAIEQAPLNSYLDVLRRDGQGVPSQLILHNRANLPIEAKYGRERTVYLNPWTAEIIGGPSKTTHAFFSAVERVHRSLGLGMKSAFGRGVTGAATLAFLFLIVSGAFLWVPTVLSFANLKSRLLFRRGLQGKAREWNWHNVIGIWSSVPLFILVLTGVIIAYPWASNLLYKVTGSEPPARDERNAHANAPNRSTASPSAAPLQTRSLDELVQVAKLQVPAWNSITLDVPQAQDQTLNVSIDKSVGGQPEQVSQLVIHRPSGRVVAVRNFSDNNAGRKLRAWARFLHTGEEFGFIGQTIAAFACLGAVFLVWTGLSLALRRFRTGFS
jgi:uncharacterized iron-regulated membrane protein